MNFNLNDNSLAGGGSVIFNQGIAGKVDNVKIEVKKRATDEPDSYPDYKLVLTDDEGGTVNQGFYYHKDNDQYDAAKNEANAGYLIGRILSIAKAIVPNDFIFPNVEGKSTKEIVDILFKIIKENSDEKRVNAFVTYGTKTKPSQYLGLRFFNFVEASDSKYSRLKPTGNDMMERLVEDSPKTGTTQTQSLDW
jgi:hypothetical protein